MTSLPTSFVSDMEIANGAQPLDELLAELDETEAEWADGASLYGMGGLFGDKRKSLLSVIALRIRDERAEQGLKSTDAMIDDMSHADKEYRHFLDSHVMRRAKWLALDASSGTVTQVSFIAVMEGSSWTRETTKPRGQRNDEGNGGARKDAGQRVEGRGQRLL